MPSIAVHINEPLVTCMIGNHALTLASSGFNNIIASATKLGLHHINTGLSSLGTFAKNATIWDGTQEVGIKMWGNYFGAVAIALPTIQLRIPEEYFNVIGILGQMVSFYVQEKMDIDSSTLVEYMEDADDPEVCNFYSPLLASLSTADLRFNLKLGELTGGARFLIFLSTC